jgi:hypothetical protein
MRTGERSVHQLFEPLLHRYGSRDEGNLHVQSHVVALREILYS